MMKRVHWIAAALVLATLPASPAVAGWKLISHDVAVKVAKGPVSVTPQDDWNKAGPRPIKKSEVWTLDGVNLNELYFVSGLIAGETLYRDNQKKDRPLPTFASSMQLLDIPEFFESSNRLVLDTSVFQVTSVEPMPFGGKDGIRFTYEYAMPGSSLVRKGVAAATLDGGMLYLISFTAPAVYYFDRDHAKAEAIMASVQF